jgi:hypothetical protein
VEGINLGLTLEAIILKSFKDKGVIKNKIFGDKGNPRMQLQKSEVRVSTK